MNKDWENLPRKLLEEKITNRVLLNFGYLLAGYILLYVLYLFAMGRIGIEYITSYGYIMLGIMCVALAAMLAFYIVGHIKSSCRWKNYGHMMLGISAVAFYLNLAFYIRWLKVDALPGFLNTALSFLRNTRNAYIITAILMLVYLVIVIVYNSVLLYKKPAASTGKKKAGKKR